jgi:biopolymer transport protein ExbB
MKDRSVSISMWLRDLNNSDPIVMGVLYLLLALSLLSWFLIAYKAIELWKARLANGRYAKWFWGTLDQTVLNNGLPPRSGIACPFAHLTESGLQALKHYQVHQVGSAGGVAGTLVEILTRALRQAIQDQVTHFEAGLGILATIGNTAPFIGLFGTVIGIMTALKGISLSGSAGLDVVAGPIGEALIATGAGIGCAVPAVVAYNTFVRRARVLSNALDGFAYDLLARLLAEEATKTLRNQKTEVKV